MITEGFSFMKGLLLGVILCIGVTFLANVNKGPQSAAAQHEHHHIQAPDEKDILHFPNAKHTQLAQSVRVYCIILVKPAHLAQWAVVKETWSKHCDKAEFYSSEETKAFESISLGASDMWVMMRKAYMYAYEHYKNDYNWFFLAHPTTFVVVENLKYFLLDKDPKQPYYVGNVIRSGELDYIESKGGILLSIEALRRFNSILDNPNRCPERKSVVWGSLVDETLALCLRYKGVFAENAEDGDGKGLFNTNTVNGLITEAMAKQSQQVLEGCCSGNAITFNGVSPDQMRIMMYGVYRLHAYGHSFIDSLVFLPPVGSDND